MPVYCNNAICILIYHDAPWIHAEGSDKILKLLCPVYDLALVQLVRQMGKDLCRQLYPDANINTVRLCGDFEIPADPLHPLAAAAPGGDDHLIRLILVSPRRYTIALFGPHHFLHRGSEKEIYFILQPGIQIFQNNIIDVRPQMAHGGVQKMQVIFHTELLDPCIRRGIQRRPLSAIPQIDLIHIIHQFCRLPLSNVFVQRTAKLIGNIIFSVGKCPRSAETIHNGTALTVNTGFHPVSVNRAPSVLQLRARLKNRDLSSRAYPRQLISGKNPPWSCPYNDNIVSHRNPDLLLFSFYHIFKDYLIFILL